MPRGNRRATAFAGWLLMVVAALLLLPITAGTSAGMPGPFT
jgi:hypothetical protein